MLAFYDLLEEAKEAGFPDEMVAALKELRLRFLEEFERRFPGQGKSRAVWR